MKKLDDASRLRIKNLELEKQLKEQTAVVDSFKRGELGAENKIKALNEMNSAKIKCLLKSIDTLKKELSKQKMEQKDNVRAKIIDKLKSELNDQEKIIEILRKEISNEDRTDRAILEGMNKGPKRIRVATREELKIDNKKLKNQIVLLRNQAKSKGGRNGEEGDLAKENVGNNNLSQRSGEISINLTEMDGGNLQLELEEMNHKLNLDLKEKNEKILQLLEEMEETNIEKEGLNMGIQKYQQEINNLYKQLREMTHLENSLKIIGTKKIAIEEENERLRNLINEKFLLKEEENLDQNEIELENRGLLERITVLQDQLDGERKEMNSQVEGANKDNEKLIEQIHNMQQQLSQLDVEMEDTDLTRKQIESSLKEKLIKIEASLNQKSEKLKVISEDYKKILDEKEGYLKRIQELEEKLGGMQVDLEDKKLEVEVFQAKIDDFEELVEKMGQQIKELEVKEGEITDTGLAVDKGKIEEMKRQVNDLTYPLDKRTQKKGGRALRGQ